MQLSVVTSTTSVKLLLEGGCGFGCSLSDDGGMLTKNFRYREVRPRNNSIFVSEKHQRLPKVVERGRWKRYLAGKIVELTFSHSGRAVPLPRWNLGSLIAIENSTVAPRSISCQAVDRQ